jgi:hypothetical protein
LNEFEKCYKDVRFWGENNCNLLSDKYNKPTLL